MRELFGVREAGSGVGVLAGARARVKICGITNREDAETAIELGADALGFNTSPRSTRFIDVGREEGWIRNLPRLATRVAVTVDSTLAELEELGALELFDIIQLHGAEDAAFCRLLGERGIPFIKAVALGGGSPLQGVEDFGAAAILLDTFTPRGFGGTGELIDLDAVAEFTARHPALRLVVSGGLRPENVAAVIRRVRPYAVDVASGVEAGPRRKDRKLLASFLEAVRTAG